MNKILESTKFVADNSRYVSINQDRLIEFSKTFEHGRTSHWLSQAPFDFSSLSEDEKLKFLLVFNALSFCYWGEPKWTIEHDNKSFDGAWGMVVALGRGIKEGFSLTNFDYCSKLTNEDFKKILRGNTDIPLFDERLRILHEIGSLMASKFKGDINLLLKQSDNDALKLLDMVTQNFPSFQDISNHKERQIYFYKRAQLLVSDLSQMAKNYSFKNVDQLTACADYKLPQILRRFGIFEYRQELLEKIDKKIELPHNSEEEIEIRANTIWAVEYIKEQVKDKNPEITSMGIDDHLWLASQEKFPDEKPYHRTRTITY